MVLVGPVRLIRRIYRLIVARMDFSVAGQTNSDEFLVGPLLTQKLRYAAMMRATAGVLLRM